MEVSSVGVFDGGDGLIDGGVFGFVLVTRCVALSFPPFVRVMLKSSKTRVVSRVCYSASAMLLSPVVTNARFGHPHPRCALLLSFHICFHPRIVSMSVIWGPRTGDNSANGRIVIGCSGIGALQPILSMTVLSGIRPAGGRLRPGGGGFLLLLCSNSCFPAFACSLSSSTRWIGVLHGAEAPECGFCEQGMNACPCWRHG